MEHAINMTSGWKNVMDMWHFERKISTFIVLLFFMVEIGGSRYLVSFVHVNYTAAKRTSSLFFLYHTGNELF